METANGLQIELRELEHGGFDVVLRRPYSTEDDEPFATIRRDERDVWTCRRPAASSPDVDYVINQVDGEFARQMHQEAAAAHRRGQEVDRRNQDFAADRQRIIGLYGRDATD